MTAPSTNKQLDSYMLTARVSVVIVCTILAIGQYYINQQVSQFKKEVETFHQQAVQGRAAQAQLTIRNHNLLKEIERELSALRSRSNATRSGG